MTPRFPYKKAPGMSDFFGFPVLFIILLNMI